MNIIFTVCNRTSLANALALASSVAQYPENIFYLCWVDNIELTGLSENIRVVHINQLDIPGWKKMTSLYYDFELVPACRPWFANYIMSLHEDQDTYIFLAPTVMLYRALNEITALKGSMLLTPNINAPLKKSALLDDKRILNVGMFHSGSWMLRKTEETLKFINWWAVRTIDRAKFDLCNGMCMDQLWLNYSLVKIPDALQIPHPGWHYGLQSVLNKKITEKEGQLYVNGLSLITVDFAGLDFFDPIWSDHAGLEVKSESFIKLHSGYKKQLLTFKELIPKESEPGLGRNSQIKANRLFRKKIIQKLSSITRFIDQIPLNHPPA